MRKLLTSALFATLLPGIATAQDRPTLLDFLSLDVLTQRIMQSGIMMLRTQLDLKYSDMSVDFLTGAITISDVRAWPLPDWDDEGTCEVSIDRMTLRGGALDEPDRARVKAQLINVEFPSSCLPREPRQGLAMAGLDRIEMPRMTIDLDYGMPNSDATMRIFADISGAAVADLNLDFAYVWFDGREDMEEPKPVVFLRNATLSLENQGIWQALSGQLPPPMTGEGAGLFVEGALGQALLEMNGEGGSLSAAQSAFVASAATAWPAFLQSPETLVLETQIDGDVYIDFEALEDAPTEAFDLLQPHVALAPASRSDALPIELLKAATGSDADSLSPEDRKRVGIALLTGVGAPRFVEAGLGLLNPMARDGDGEAAKIMAEALFTQSPEDAYRWAIVAGAAGETGATAIIDRLEKTIPFGRVLELQKDVSGNAQHDRKILSNIADVRAEAAARFSGSGQARSYGIAAMWAMIGAAAGDAESRDILNDITERVRLSGDGAAAVWAGVEQDASKLAMDAWIGLNLPAAYAK